MKRNLSFFTILLLIFSICGCKLHHILPEKDIVQNDDEHIITILLNEYSSARTVANPGIDLSSVIYYKIIITLDGNAKTYHFAKNETISVPVKNGINTFEIAAYNGRTGTLPNYEYSTPILYSKTSETINSETTSIRLSVSPIIKTYTEGELAGVPDNGTIVFTVRMPLNTDVSDKIESVSVIINGSTKLSTFTFKAEDKTKSSVVIGNTAADPGVYNCSIIVKTTDNQNFLYSQTAYCAMNLVTAVVLDLTTETFTLESCGELGQINFYKGNESSSNLIEFNKDILVYTCNGIDRTKTYYLELTMKVAGQKIDVSIKKDGDTDFGSPLDINTLSGHEISFVDSNPAESNNYIQKLKYSFGENQTYWMDATGGSEVKISVSKGGASKDYIIKLSPEVPVLPEDTEVSHPVDVSAMTALPDPVTVLTETNYVITTEAQLFALSSYVNGGGETEGKTFVLGENISLNSEWVPIGEDVISPFMGTFNGNNYKVSDLSVTADNSNYGFIGSMKNGTILNLTVEGTINVSGDHVAGICAYVSGNSKINNCINNVIVNGRDYCGGISAYYDGDSLEITNCVNFGSVTGYDNCSGIIGITYVPGTSVINCVNLADVTSDINAAGIVLTRDSTIIENSYSAGIISGTICESPISYGFTDATLKNCYYLKDCTYESGALFVRNALGSAYNPDAEDVSSFTHSAGDGNCTLTKTVNSKTDLLQALNSYSGIDTNYNIWVYSQNSSYNGLPVFNDTMARLNQGAGLSHSAFVHKPIDSSIKSASEFGSVPTSGETIKIASAEDLRMIQTWNTSSNLEGVTFILSDEIDLSGSGFNKIYNNVSPFCGIFDGNGYEIKNLSPSTSSYNGLFGNVGNNAVIRNLKLSGAYGGSNYSGGIIGYATGSVLVENCIVNLNLTLTSTNGGAGIVGYYQGSNGELIIRNCCNLGNVSSKSYTGGIAGYFSDTNHNSKLIIENCANYGDISNTGSNGASGICGYTQSTAFTYNNCFNYGLVTQNNITFVATNGGDTEANQTNCYFNSNVNYARFSNKITESDDNYKVTIGSDSFSTSDGQDLKDVMNSWITDPATYYMWDYADVEIGGTVIKALIIK